jgi:hypothetical protein
MAPMRGAGTFSICHLPFVICGVVMMLTASQIENEKWQMTSGKQMEK